MIGRSRAVLRRRSVLGPDGRAPRRVVPWHGRSLDTKPTALRAFDLLSRERRAGSKAVVEGARRTTACEGAATSTRRRPGFVCGDFLLHRPRRRWRRLRSWQPAIHPARERAGRAGAAYRRACPTMRGRSDIFVGFIETGLRLLRPERRRSGFIVADRWMHNQYGAGLRDLVSADFAVEAVVSDARRRRLRGARVGLPGRHDHPSRASVDGSAREHEQVVRREATPLPSGSGPGSRSKRLSSASVSADEAPDMVRWRLVVALGLIPRTSRLVADLERRFAPAGVSRPGHVSASVSPPGRRRVPHQDSASSNRIDCSRLLMTRDTNDGAADWSGTYLVNPWRDGRSVELARYPRLRARP